MKSFTAGGGNYALDNSDSSTKSYGLEFQADWKPSEDLQFIIGYTKTGHMMVLHVIILTPLVDQVHLLVMMK